MRKVDPDAVRQAFVSECDSLGQYFTRVSDVLEPKPHALADISSLAETTFLAGFVVFERFLSDLFLAYLNRDFSQYQVTLRTRISSSVTDKFGAWAQQRTHFAPKAHVAVAELEDLVDPTRQNLTFSSAELIRIRGNEWLAGAHATRVASFNADDERLIDTARSLRNFIAHRSTSSRDAMNAALGSVDRGGENRGLGRGAHLVHNVGAFLKAYGGQTRRIEGYLARLSEIGQNM